jgi:hypothetical protein
MRGRHLFSEKDARSGEMSHVPVVQAKNTNSVMAN